MAFAGQKLTASLLGVAVSSAETAAGSTTSTTFTATLTGGTACGVVFVAPASGTVIVHNSAFVDNSSTPRSYMTFRIRTGSTIGSGTDVVAALDENAVSVLSSNDAAFGRAVMVTGLTADATYNCQQLFKVSTASTGTFQWKKLIVQPVA